MKVSKAIEMLSKYNNLDDEIVIAWWGDENANGQLTKEQWSEVVRIIDEERDEECWSGVGEFIVDVINEVDVEAQWN